MKFKAVAFDLDGTLVKEPSSWYTIHKFFGTYEDSKKNMLAYETGKIDYKEFMKLDIGLWQPPPHFSTLKTILSNYTITKNSEETIKALVAKGVKPFIVTTAPDFFANTIASRLGICEIACNEILFDEKGYVTQKTVFKVDLFKKEAAFEALLMNAGFDCRECVAVGDSKYDKGFLGKAGLGIAFNPAPDCSLREGADYVIDDMQELLRFI